jgi:hypothetical protein
MYRASQGASASAGAARTVKNVSQMLPGGFFCWFVLFWFFPLSRSCCLFPLELLVTEKKINLKNQSFSNHDSPVKPHRKQSATSRRWVRQLQTRKSSRCASPSQFFSHALEYLLFHTTQDVRKFFGDDTKIPEDVLAFGAGGICCVAVLLFPLDLVRDSTFSCKPGKIERTICILERLLV